MEEGNEKAIHRLRTVCGMSKPIFPRTKSDYEQAPRRETEGDDGGSDGRRGMNHFHNARGMSKPTLARTKRDHEQVFRKEKERQRRRREIEIEEGGERRHAHRSADGPKKVE